MAVLARCSCGGRTGVSDAMIGRTVRCPKCGNDILVTAGGGGGTSKGAPGKGGKATPKGKPAAAPAVAISPTVVIGGTVLVLVVGVALALYLGPWTVGNQWAAMAPKANSDVTDVVMFALQAHQSQGLAGADADGGGAAVAMSLGKAPAIEGPAVFVPPMMAFSMPRQLLVSGRTSQGSYVGTYNTTSGEVDLNIDVGGYTVGGLVDVRHPTGKIHVTGRETNGQVSAEEDGVPMKIIIPKYRGRGE
jgi:hypothetical protein